MSNIYDFEEMQQRAAAARTWGAIDDDPDDSARAMQLGEMSGTPPASIVGDKEFEENWKAGLNTHIIRNNPDIQDYVNSHPLAASVSKDDYGQLDKISEMLRKSGTPLGQAAWAAIKAAPDTWDVAKSGVEQLKHAFSGEQTKEDEEQADQIRRFIESQKPGVTPEQIEAEVRLLQSRLQRGELEQLPAALGQIALSPLLGPARTFVTRPLADALSRQLGTTVTPEMVEGYLMVGGAAVGLKFEAGAADRAAINRRLDEISGAVKKVEPFARANQSPPVGLDELVDKFKEEQLKEDLKNHKELASEVEKSTTKERWPRFIEDFVEIVNGRRTFAVSWEKLQQLYGDKEPMPGDGLIGDVTGAREQYRFAATSQSGHVHIPEGEWLARVPKEVRDELWDDIQFRPDGISKNEHEELKQWWEVQQQREAEAAVAELEVPPTPPPEAPLPIREMRQAAGIPRGDDYPPAPGFKGEPKAQTQFLGGKFDTLASTTVSQALKLRGTSFDKIRQKLIDLIGDVQVHVLPGDQVLPSAIHPRGERPRPLRPKEKLGGYYDPQYHQVIISENTWRSGKGGILLHEIVHAATFRALELRPQLRAAISIFMDHLKNEVPDLMKHYGMRDMEPSEFIAEAMSNPDFQRDLAKIKLTEKMAEAFEIKEWKAKTAWRGFVEWVHDRVLGLSGDVRGHSALDAAMSAAEDVMDIQAGIGPKEMHRFERWREDQPTPPAAAVKEPFEAPDQFEKGQAIGYVENAWKKIQRFIAEQRKDELSAQHKKAVEDAKKKTSAEWKANRVDIRREVADQISNHPTPAAAEFFRDGRYYGQAVKESTKLDGAKLTPEQKKALPREFWGRDGLDPEDAAGMFGFDNPNDMIEQVAAYERDRGKMRPDNYMVKLIEGETDRRMQEKYGSLAEQTLREAQEHITNGRHISLLHAEMEYLARVSGQQIPFTKEGIRAAARKGLGLMPPETIKSKYFFNQAGKHGRAVEMAFIKGDYIEAFRQHQAQYIAMLRAKEALKIEREFEKGEDVAQKYTKRDVRGASGEYVPWTQQLIMDHGYRVARNDQDLAAAMEHTGFDSWEGFTKQKVVDGAGLKIDPRMYNPRSSFYRMPVGKMMTDDLLSFYDAVVSMDKAAREEQKFTGAIRAKRFDNARDEGVDLLKDRWGGKQMDREEPITKFQKFKSTAKYLIIGHINWESIFDWIGKGDSQSFWHQYFIYPMTEAASGERQYMKIYDKRLKDAVGRLPNYTQRIKNDFWEEPGQPGVFRKLRKAHLYGLIQIVGNEENLGVLAAGYKKTPEEVMRWLEQNSKPEDWDRAQRIGNVFKPLFEEADRKEYQRSGTTLKRVELAPFQMHGKTYEGWYHPLKYDANRPGESPKATHVYTSDLFKDDYFMPSTPHGYALARTGYVAPLEFKFDSVPARLSQMIHDIHFRDPIRNLAKMVKDKEFHQAFVDYVGKEWYDQLMPFLREMANYTNYNSKAEFFGSRALEVMRQNLIHTLIGFNPHTMTKHGMTAAFNSGTEVGWGNLQRAISNLQIERAPGQTNWRFSMESSKELDGRLRNAFQQFEGHPEMSLMKSSMRGFIQSAGSFGVGFLDLLSAVPTWLAQYEKSMADRAGVQHSVAHAESVIEADRAVRRAHGSSLVTNRPMVMRTNALGRWYGSLYGFFSHMMQKQFELTWRTGEAAGKIKAGQTWEGMKDMPRLFNMFFSYVIIPAAVEELVTPYLDHDKDSLTLRAAKGLGMGLTSSAIGIRDLYRSAVNNVAPQLGLGGTFGGTITHVISDLRRKRRMDAQEIGRLWKDTHTLIGALTGFSNSQIGRTGEYLIRWVGGEEHPKGAGWLYAATGHGEPGLITGLTTGKTVKRYRR